LNFSTLQHVGICSSQIPDISIVPTPRLFGIRTVAPQIAPQPLGVRLASDLTAHQQMSLYYDYIASKAMDLSPALE
jgi:hypothetical protein